MPIESAERWARIEMLFSQALDLPPPERREFLDTSCSRDPGLRAVVSRLLAAHEASEGFLDSLNPEQAGALLDAAPPDEALPASIGPYRVVRRLGGGGMGIVYLAHDPRLERPVAIKLLRPRPGPGAEARRRLQEEARAASALDHPNIAPIYEIGEAEDGRLFIAMAYCEGESLADRIARGPLEPRDAAGLARQVADALAAAHRQGIVHRDVKPANVIVSPGGRARLVDFGVAIVAGQEGPEAGLPAGTPAYMSPEQTRAGDVDHRADVWAVGVMLYEMLTGRRPFGGDDAVALLQAIREQPHEPVRRHRPAVGGSLASLVDHCLEKDPSARPPGAAALAVALARFTNPDATGAGRSDRRRAARIMLGAGLVLVAGVGAIWLRPWGGSRPAVAGETSLVVVPFAPVAPDTALERLGRELVVTVAANLDGAGGMHVIEPITVLGQAPAGESIQLANAAALAQRLGAGRLIHGQLSRAGAGVRLDATVLAARNLEVLGRASAEAPLDDVTALTDSITLALMRGGWSGAASAVPNLAALTTSSVPALRAYLEGELAIAGARFRAAAPAFARAIAADSTFWFAYWRYLYARSYHGDPVDSAIVATVHARRGSFPEPDRMLVETRMIRSQHARLAGLRELTQRFPVYWPAWFELADQLTHVGPFLGHGFEEARSALERTAELNSRFVPAWEHLFWLAVLERDTAASSRAFARLTALGIDSLMRGEVDLGTLDFYRYLDRLGRTGGRPDAAEARIGAEILAEYTGPLEPERLAVSLLNYGFHRAQADLGRRVHARGARPAVLAAQTWAEALAWAGRGAWDSAFAAARQYARATRHPNGPVWAYGLLTVGAWLGQVSPDSALALREEALRSPGGRAEDGALEIVWLDGLLACARRDRAALDRARAALDTSGAPAAATLEASLSAFQTALAGRWEDAARALAALEWDHADTARVWRFGSRHPFMVPINRLAAGRWLIAAGDTTEALRLFTVHTVDLPGTLNPFPATSTVLGALMLPDLARVEEARGNSERAARYRAWFRERVDLLPVEVDAPVGGWSCGGWEE